MDLVEIPSATLGSQRDLEMLGHELRLDAELAATLVRWPYYPRTGSDAAAGFAEALTDEQRDRVLEIAAEHTGVYRVADPMALRVGAAMSPPRPYLQAPPLDFDFRLASPKLHKIVGARNAGGFVERWDWVPMVDMGFAGVASAPAVCEHHTYTLTPDGFTVIKRVESIEWIRNDGVGHPTQKERTKFYVSDHPIHTSAAQAKEGSKRRGALVDEAKGQIIAWLLATGGTFAQGQALMATIADAVKLYIESSDPGILTAIDTADPVAFAWLDTADAFDETLASPVRDGTAPTGVMVTPRQYMGGLLNIYGA